MTSNRSYFNMAQSLGRFKRTAWMSSMALAVLFFALPVTTAIYAQNIQRRIVNNALNPDQILSQSLRLFENIGIATAVIALAGGVIAALFTWNYLNSRRQVDFYHALPYKRATLFGSYWAAGMATFIIPYLIMELISLGIFSMLIGFGANGGILWPVIFEEAGRTLLMFFVSFATTTLACVLCGNLFVAFCGTMVFFGLPSAMWGLMILLFTRCYDTFSSAALPTETYLSYTTAVYDLFEGNGDPRYLYWSLVAAALTALACFIYARRPSEAAERAMAFPFTQPIVKFPMVLAATVMLGLFFESLGDNTTGWLIFGFVAGALLSNAIIEIIFEFDLKSALRGLRGLAIFGLVFAAGISVMLNDLTGYDTRLPKEGAVTSVSIHSNTLSSMLYQSGPLVDGRPIAYQGTKDVLDYYTFTDPVIIDGIVELAKAGVETVQGDGETPEDYTYWSYIVLTVKEGAGSYTRSYRVPVEAEREALAKMFTSDEFKQKLYAVFTMEAAGISSVHIRDNLRYTDMTGNYSSQALIEELLTALRSDILRMTPATLRTETALFSVVLENGNYDRSIPVYSNFIATMGVLEKYSIKVPVPLTADEVRSIEVYTDNSDLYEKYGAQAGIWPESADAKSQYAGSSITITDKAEIARLLPMLIMSDDDQQNLGLLESVGNLYFSVYATDEAGGWSHSFMLRPEYASEVTVGMALSPAASAA
ncbi:MAG TPA: DUF6449 domain-containing protein [Terriglobales bacterium]|nr:DUF6449 domain-containing protein [Terriglobales bacterium]